MRRQLVDALAVEVDLAAAGLSSPEMVRRMVVLPAPLLPMSVTRLPASTENDTPFTAAMRPYATHIADLEQGGHGAGAAGVPR